MNRIGRVEELERQYLQLRRETPLKKRNGAECDAYHAWYDESYSLFSAYPQLVDDDDFERFKKVNNSGNCFQLEHTYESIRSNYKVLLDKVQKIEENKNNRSDNKEGSQILNAADNLVIPYQQNYITKRHPVVFVSYSWVPESNKKWVSKLSGDLRKRGIDVQLDEYLDVGCELNTFMIDGITKADRVLVIGTPDYKKRSEASSGGAAIEGKIITNEICNNIDTNKFIPILREGTFKESFPLMVMSRKGYDFTDDSKYNNLLEELVADIFGVQDSSVPELGPIPKIN